jgi:hypothetical protein
MTIDFSASPEELAAALLEELKTAAASDAPASALAAGIAPGFLSAMEEWARSHPTAVGRLTQIVLPSLSASSPPAPLAALLVPIAEWAQTLIRAEKEGVDAFLVRRPPHVVAAPDGSRWTLLTPITDPVMLARELLGPVPERPHYRKAPPVVHLVLGEGHDPEALRASLGISLRQQLELEEAGSSPARLSVLLAGVAKRMNEIDPALGAGVNWVLLNEPEAVASLPFVKSLTSRLSGSAERSDEMRAQFVHPFEVGPMGYAALIWWNDDVPLSRRQRVHLAGHIRYVADRYVAPWHYWPDRRSRREAFAVYVQHLHGGGVRAAAVANELRHQLPAEYVDEPLARTIKRIYRISTALHQVFVPPQLAKLVATTR